MVYPSKIDKKHRSRYGEHQWVQLVFFGNYFYGFCAVALSVEAVFQQGFRLNSLLYYLMIFTGSIVYYTFAYVKVNVRAGANERTLWYARHRNKILWSQLLLSVFVFCGGICYLAWHWEDIWRMSWISWFLLMVFPCVALFYYGFNSRSFANYKLRNIGWLKPFIIGFVWAGIVTTYPAVFYHLEHHLTLQLPYTGLLLFLENFMFIAVLCIMFDIKDYAMDYNQDLKTFVVKVGLRKTIFSIIIPLCFAGLASFILYAMFSQFHPVRIMLNAIPFLFAILVAYSLSQRKSILYYLVVIDGLMLLKALCGTIAKVYF
jgi:4-hydroxybenzoate polyprenyltransferase